MQKKVEDSHPENKKGTINQIIEWFSPLRRKRRAGDAADSPAHPIPPDARTFAEFELSEAVRKGIEDAGFVHCTPVQELSLPIALEG